MQLEIKDWVEEACRAGELAKKEFYIIQANVFYLTEEKSVVPAEVCVARVPRPSRSVPTLTTAACWPGWLSYWALYTLPRARWQTGLVLAWQQERAGPSPALRLYSLPCLLFQLARVGGEVTGGTQVPAVSLAEVQLNWDWFLYTPGMACAWHQQRDKTVHCSEALVRRWSYILLHICCPRHHLTFLHGRHRPSGSRDTGSSVTSRSDRSRDAVRVPRWVQVVGSRTITVWSR
jgi:hypothetical protein